MSKFIPGNQKHLTLEDRKYIEKSLNAGCSFKDIARYLCKDPTTISKEVKLHRLSDWYHKGCFNNAYNFCIHRLRVFHCFAWWLMIRYIVKSSKYRHSLVGYSMAYGKSIELFLANGTADSLITAELSNWNGKAIKIPRIEVAECKRTDIKGAGVYFLFCKEEDDSDSVYIGESESVHDRLLQHLRDYSSEKEKFYWTTAVIFLGRDLNKALIRYLEDRFVQIARDSKRYKVLTKNTYGKTVMKESQTAAMEEFIDNVKVIINALGYKVLEPTVQSSPGSFDDSELLYLNMGNAKATGVVTTEGFVLFAGAIVNEKTSEKSLSKGAVALRKKHFDAGKVKALTTTEDIIFSSSSAAADFVTGYSVSGPANWRNKNGETLKEIEAKESK